MIQVTCAHCGLSISVPPTVQGKVGICFNCGQKIQAPRLAAIKQHQDLNFDPGDRISDRYIIEHSIGKGGMGVVYKAQDTLINETVALKFMSPRMLRTQHGKKLFLQEAQIARRLRHDNIVAVHDVAWTDDGILYLSMEYAEGQSLRRLLRQQRQDRSFLSIRLAVHFMGQMLDALHYAHRTVIHRDIKPENVMVQPGEVVKVLDFGLAKAVHEEYISAAASPNPIQNNSRDAESTPNMPSQSKFKGTFAYAAPEQKQRFPIDLRADIFAAGLVFYELLTLRTPLDEAIPAEKARADIAPSLLEVLNKALQPERENRWTSAMDFKQALDSAYQHSYKPQVNIVSSNAAAGKASTEQMVHLEGGSFLMGNNQVREEAPEAEMVVAPFWIDLYPVTMRDYMAYVKATGATPPKYHRDTRYNGPEQPVIGVSWSEAQAYAAWAGKSLPSELQWEFAARGKQNRRYPWGSLPPDSTRCNFSDYLGMTANVTMHDGGATPECICDLLGNVWEWTVDPFAPYALLRQNPEAAAGIPRKAARGASWKSPVEELRCTIRQGFFPESRLEILGFRCVLNDAL